MELKQIIVLGLVVSSLFVTGCVTKTAEQQAKDRNGNVADDAVASSDNEKPDKPLEALLYESRVNFAVGNLAEAEKLARQATEQKPDDTQPHMLLANICLIEGNIKQAVASFDEMIRLKPELQPYLWQRGLALYWADEFEKGKAQFETHQDVNSQDVENAVWHLLCAARVEGLEAARKQMIPIKSDKRIPMKQIYEVFAGRLDPEKVIEAATESPDIQQSLYYGFLYNGLYYEMIGEKEKCIESMEKAEKAKSLTNKDDLMNQVATIHLRLRKKTPTEPQPGE
jgi:lipoprotein NlpI